MNLKSFINERKYEILLVALVQHLYIGIFVTDLAFYTEVIWPINMVILGLASVGVFIEKGRTKKSIKNALTFFVVLLPILLPFFRGIMAFMVLLNICYVIYYSFIFLEVFKFLIKPIYINTDIISATACGLFLLIEIFVFLFQMWVYRYPHSFKGVDYSDPALTFMDLVYFCSVTLTTIGYGDITPNVYFTKLTTSLIGVAGQCYSVVLVGILISKFTSNQSK
jgi:hypothetical protein